MPAQPRVAVLRAGDYAAAEQSLKVAAQTAGQYHELVGVADTFLSMNLSRLGRGAEARDVFHPVEKEMPSPPKTGSEPLVAGKAASHDVMICWVVYQEAQALFNEPARHDP